MTDAVAVAPATTAVRLIPVFEAKPGSERELARLLADLQTASRRDAGCVEYLIFSDGESQDTFVLYEEWTSRAALDAHNEQRHVREFLAAAEQVMARKLRVYLPSTLGDDRPAPGE